MRLFIAVLFLSATLCCGPLMAAQQTYDGEILADNWAGYNIYLPTGWKPVHDKSRITELFEDVCAFVSNDDQNHRGFTNIQAGVLPNAPGNPAIVSYWMDYRMMGLDEKMVSKMAEDSERVVADVANTIQASYKEKYPNSIMINSHLDTDTFILYLRSILDFNNEMATTRNQIIRMTFGRDGIITIASLYTGPQDATLDGILARTLREVYIDQEKTFAKAAPAFSIGIIDYVMWIGVVLFVLYFIGRRKLKKQGKA